jgi:hypothetical protein
MPWRRPRGKREIDDRAWSTRPKPQTGEATTDMVPHSALPAETGPTWAPDQLSVWPVEGGRYGLDAHYHGATGRQRAQHQRSRLATVNISASVTTSADEETILRIGPLQHRAAWLALEAFLGRPVEGLDDASER